MSDNFVSTIDTSITEEYLRIKRESQFFERKSFGVKGMKATKIANELIGMLNAGGGVLAFGVTDSGEIQGLNDASEDELDKYRSLTTDFICPACNVKLEEVEIKGKLVFLYHAELDLERIFYRKESEDVFLRILDTNRKLNMDEIKKLEYDKNIRRFEDEPIKEFEIEDLDENLLKSYKEKINFKGTPLDLLCKRYLAKKKNNTYIFNNSSILLFSHDPEKYIPSASVRYVRYEGTIPMTGVEHNVVKDERFEDNIPNLIDELKKFIKASIKDYYYFDMNDGKFKKVPEYPEEAWLEGVVNALCHRSYNVQGNPIYIKHFDDRLEISNSGPLPAQVTIENIRNERYARNPRLARVLEDLGYVRQLNEGVSRIYESMEKSMLSVPEYKEINGTVYLILRNKISNNSKTIDNIVMNLIEDKFYIYNDTQKKIIGFLFDHQKATKKLLVEKLGIHKNTISRNLNLMIDDGIVERVSEKKRDSNALYMFNRKPI